MQQFLQIHPSDFSFEMYGRTATHVIFALAYKLRVVFIMYDPSVHSVKVWHVSAVKSICYTRDLSFWTCAKTFVEAAVINLTGLNPLISITYRHCQSNNEANLDVPLESTLVSSKTGHIPTRIQFTIPVFRVKKLRNGVIRFRRSE